MVMITTRVIQHLIFCFFCALVFWYRGSKGPCTCEAGGGTTELNPQPNILFLMKK